MIPPGREVPAESRRYDGLLRTEDPDGSVERVACGRREGEDEQGMRVSERLDLERSPTGLNRLGFSLGRGCASMGSSFRGAARMIVGAESRNSAR